MNLTILKLAKHGAAQIPESPAFQVWEETSKAQDFRGKVPEHPAALPGFLHSSRSRESPFLETGIKAQV